MSIRRPALSIACDSKEFSVACSELFGRLRRSVSLGRDEQLSNWDEVALISLQLIRVEFVTDSIEYRSI
jgi:hypothetical protein